MSNEINVEELGRLAKAATPGPWRWEFNATHKRLHLVGGRPQYDLTIMGFDRWGMGGAVATLRDTSEDGMNIMHRLCDRPDWIAPFAGRAHHAGWCSDVTHPDMRLIATANPSTILSLIDRMKKAEAELERERMRLAACGVVALADTPESAAKAREMRDEYRSASCDDVARRVDECMTLRAERDALAAKLAELEGQEPTAWMNAKRDMASFIRFHEDDLPLFARPVPVEPVNVDFGMRGENMFFQIGNQSFLLDYKPEEPGEFEFMKAMLLSAFSRITHGVKTESQPVNARILDVSTGKLEHINAGLCPDSINGPDSRDPACPACRAIAEADADSKLENFMLKFGEADFPAGYCLDPNGKMSVPFGREEDFNFGYEIGFREAWEITNSAIRAAVKPPTQQQERLLQDMHDAGREIDRVMAEATPKAARLTDEEIASLLAASDKNSPRVPSFFMTEPHKFARVIETAAIRKNGLAMED